MAGSAPSLPEPRDGTDDDAPSSVGAAAHTQALYAQAESLQFT